MIQVRKNFYRLIAVNNPIQYPYIKSRQYLSIIKQ